MFKGYEFPKITGAFLNVTQGCNLGCRYCFVTQKPNNMTYKVAKDAVDYLAENALDESTEPSITFFGGEPMLRYEDIVKPLTEYIRERYGYFDISITNNGTLLNEERYEFFKENDVGMLLSLDGFKEIQDYNRPYHDGTGSFDDIDIDMHLKYYPRGTFRATVDPDTVHMMYENYLWGEKQGFTNCAFIPNTEGNWTEERLETYKRELDKIVDYIMDKKEKKEPYMSFNFTNNKRDYLKFCDKGYRVRGEGLPACGKCGLGASMFGAIGPTGDIYSCQELVGNEEYEQFVIGNIYTGMNQKRREELAEFDIKKVRCEDKTRCSRCAMNEVCDGGCVMHNFYSTDKLGVRPVAICVIDEYSFMKMREMEGR